MRFPPLRPDRRLTGMTITFALHLALLCAWQLARQPHKHAEADDASRIQWVRIAAPRPPKPPALPPVRVRSAPAPVQHAIASATPPTEPPEVAAPVAIAAPAAPSAEQMLQQARRDLGKIDRDLRKEFPGSRIKAPSDSPQLRLAKGIEHAAEMAPPRWFEAPKVTEIIDPGGYGRRRYRVITGGGTYCVTYESNHAPDGLDTMKNGIKPKITNCPPDEQPATRQKWDQ
ncbi:MAG: hypothetical protein V4484_08445 [Pseudomonadota bacterium]